METGFSRKVRITLVDLYVDYILSLRLKLLNAYHIEKSFM
jgi:hypothetical protein